MTLKRKNQTKTKKVAKNLKIEVHPIYLFSKKLLSHMPWGVVIFALGDQR